VASYTAAGLFSSTLVGVALGLSGGWLIDEGLRIWAALVVVALAGLAALRGFGWLGFLLPRVRRQTREAWGKRFHPAIAATLWGFELGLTFATRFTFTGLAVIAGSAFVIGDPLFGGVLFGTLWIARALPAWLIPSVTRHEETTLELVGAVDRQRRLFRRINTVGVLLAAAALLAWIPRLH
jgi:hypothetical protein